MKRLRTQKRLAEALEQCLRKKPLERIRVHEVTDLCDMSRQAFYYHFADIYDLYIWTYRRKLDALIPATPTGAWRQDASAVLEHAERNRNFYLALRGGRCAGDFQAYLEERASRFLAAQPPETQEQLLADGYDQQFLAQYYAVVLLYAMDRRPDRGRERPAKAPEGPHYFFWKKEY